MKRSTKFDHLLQQLTAQALALGPGAKFPTILELCKEFDVAKATLDRALRELEIQRVIIRRHGSGIFVGGRVSLKTIGLVFTSDIFDPHHSPYWTLLLQAAQAETKRCHFKFYTYLDLPAAATNLPAHQQLIDDLESERLDGAVVIGSGATYRLVQEHGHGRVPAVLLGGDKQAPHRVEYDQVWEFKTAIRALYQQGCRRIALLAITKPEIAAIFLRVLKQSGLPASDDVLLYPKYSPTIPSRSREEFGVNLIQHLVATRQAMPDGIVSIDDTVTRGLCTGLKATHRKLGHDLRICTVSNQGSSVLQDLESALTRLEIDPGDLARNALRILDALMKGRVPRPAVAILRPTLYLPDALR